MEEDDKNTQEQGIIKDKRLANLLPHQYKKGQSGNPGGRPVGSVSMKQYVKNKLLSMTDEEREDFLEGVDKRVVWEMSEGKAKQDVEVSGELTSKIISVDE